MNRLTVHWVLAVLAIALPAWAAEPQAWYGRATLAREDGTWERIFAANGQLQITRSTDDGLTWSSPEKLVDLPEGDRWGGASAVATKDGELQVFLSRARGTGTKPAVDRFLDLWHLKSTAGRTQWTGPKRVFEGYIGALSNSIQLESGRIIIPFGMWIPGRRSAPPTGGHEVTVLYSDDNGETFKMSDARLTSPVVEGYNGSNYGACEPAIVQLKDGRVLMHMRTQTGYLYESISSDGITWTEAKPSRFYSSTGPPYLLRLKDDRIMLFWNNCAMPPRVDGQGVYGGRDVLHAAIADPDLKEWRGFREIYRDPHRDETPPRKGDRGTAYPDAILMRDGRVAVSSGQGGRRALMYVDPKWLMETKQSDDFSSGLGAWCVFKGFGPASGWWRDRVAGAELIDHPDKNGSRVLHLRRPDDKDADGATWNFPAGHRGTLTIRFQLRDGSPGGTISLGDRFFNPTDDAGEREAMFILPFGPDEAGGKRWAVPVGEWTTFTIEWDLGKGEAFATMNAQDASRLPLQHKSINGLSYLRLRSTASEVDRAGWLVESVNVEVQAP